MHITPSISDEGFKQLHRFAAGLGADFEGSAVFGDGETT